MRIAALIASLSVGGAQKLQVMFARAMRDRDVELTVATLSPSRSGDLAKELESLGVRVVPLHARSLLDPLRAARLVRFLRRGRFDVLFTHLRPANILGAVAGKIAGVPTITTLHSVSTRPARGALATWALRRATTCTVAVGQAIAEAHREKLGNARCVVIPNPVGQIPPLSPAERLATRHELVGGDRPLLVSIGRLVPEKGYPDLLAAFTELRRTHPQAALVIAGAGPLEEQLRTHIDGLSLQGHAHLIGLCRDVPHLLAAADIYVGASHSEGLPLSLLEAMAAGLPVVTTDVGDIGAVVVDGTGHLVPPHDPEALAAALKVLLEDPERARAMGAAARRHVRRNYSVNEWAERLLELGAEVSRRQPSPLPPDVLPRSKPGQQR